MADEKPLDLAAVMRSDSISDKVRVMDHFGADKMTFTISAGSLDLVVLSLKLNRPKARRRKSRE